MLSPYTHLPDKSPIVAEHTTDFNQQEESEDIHELRLFESKQTQADKNPILQPIPVCTQVWIRVALDKEFSVWTFYTRSSPRVLGPYESILLWDKTCTHSSPSAEKEHDSGLCCSFMRGKKAERSADAAYSLSGACENVILAWAPSSAKEHGQQRR